uniref:C2H2-type domain-containing protein n=1 Tax=Ditylenchus dipsaci TaxID=166011 RepID=A0A915DM96_9BILA
MRSSRGALAHNNRFDLLAENGKATNKVVCKEDHCRAILNKSHGAHLSYHFGLHEEVGPVSQVRMDEALLKFVVTSGQSMNLTSEASFINCMECFRKLAVDNAKAESKKTPRDSCLLGIH